MSRRLFGLLAFALLTITALPVRAEVAISGALSNQTRVRLLQHDMPKDYDWDVMMMMSQFDVITRAMDKDRAARLFVDFDLRYDPTGAFTETADLEWRLREAYAGYYTTYFSFEVGKKTYAWGMADEFNPTDLINPEDLRWMFTLDRPERKIGVYSANVNFMYNN
jgi:hypothetical protein